MHQLGSLKRVGYWSSRPRDGFESVGELLVDMFQQLVTGEPRVEDFVDETWSASERRRVVEYLKRGRKYEAYLGYSRCRICQRENGCLDLHDGVYVWPDGLVHYVRDHSVKPPDDFVRHVLQRVAADVWP